MSQLRANIIANLVGRGWSALMIVAFVPLYIKFMGIEAYGLVGFFATLAAVFTILDMGLSATVNRELARYSGQHGNELAMCNLVRTLEVIYWVVGILIGIVVMALSPLIANRWFSVEKLSPSTVQHVLMLMGLVIAFHWPLGFYSGGLMGLQRQVLMNGINVALGTLRSVGAVLVLLWISPTILAFFTWQLVTSVLQTSIIAACLWRSLPKTTQRPHFRKEVLLGVWHFAAGVGGISVVAVLLTQLDKVILSKLLTLKMFGYYSLATLVAGGLSLVIGPVSSALFPSFSRLVALGDEEAIKQLYHRGCQLMSVLLLPFAVLVALFPREIMQVWTGNSETANNTYVVVSLLTIGGALNGLVHLPYMLQLDYGWTRLTFYTNLTSVVLLIPLIVFMTIQYGAVGAAIVWIVLNSGYVLIYLQIMHRRLLKGEEWSWYLKDVGIPLGGALVVAGIWRWCLTSPFSTRSVLVVSLFGVWLSMQLVATLVAQHTRQLLVRHVVLAGNTVGKAFVKVGRWRPPVRWQA
jgi:O-antigen/teichoic acid export membrane protein